MEPPLLSQYSFDVMFPVDCTVDIYPSFDADSYPSPKSGSYEDSPSNLMNPPLLGDSSFYFTDSLPVYDTVATEPHLDGDCKVDSYPPFDAESIPSPKSPTYEDSPLNPTNLPFLGDSSFYFTNSFPVYDTVATESPLHTDSNLMKQEVEMGCGFVQEDLFDIYLKADGYLSMLRMMSCFLPRFIGKHDLDSPFYPAPAPAPAEVRDFLNSTYQVKKGAPQAEFGPSQFSKI